MRSKKHAPLWALLASNAAASAASRNAPDAFYAALRPCPNVCKGTPQDWTVYTSLERLAVCTEPVLLDFAIYNPLDDPNTTTKLRTCTAGNVNSTRNGLSEANETKPHKRGINYTFKEDTCTTASESKVDLDLIVSSDQGSAGATNLQAAIQHLQDFMADSTHCTTKFLVGYSQGAAVAVYSGAGLDNSRTIPSVLQQVESQLHGKSPSSATIQLCGDDRNADYTFGVAIDTTGDLAAVQKAVVAWSNGTCFGSEPSSNKLSGVSVFEAPLIPVVQSSGSGKNSTALKANSARSLEARSDCKTITVVSGDSCGSLASKCGITAQQLSTFNPSSTLCSTLAVGQRICCTSGTLPDLTPKPNSDGSCATYLVQPGDYCALIAASHSITPDQIETFNDKVTWGWNGCNDLAAGINICLSKGNPPLPAPVADTVCGPLVSGTTAPKNGQSLADLNPCPLNSCCDVWGQCGTTPAFCTAESGPTGNPGTAPPGHNGCISNCGTDIHNQNFPAQYTKVAYYETWNWDRPCLNYRASDIAGTDYTHAHWGFAALDSNFNIIIDDSFNQLPDFLALPQKKILSFGGWGFSTDPSTFEILRSAMNPSNSDKFVANIVSFLNGGWDGVDIDWEYPGAPDIPGIPPGLASDGPNYLSFLTKLRAAIGSKTISIAAPASYWYLKAFPISDMAQKVDYIVYMTYDLHGQWDYGNAFSQDGCPAGNCARSHINITETMYALSMLTKAGVSTAKINVGVSSYGRSFGINNRAACQRSLKDPGCTIIGPDSGAIPGNCTAEAGYIANAEIDEILNLNSSDTLYLYDADSQSDTLFYGNNWVAYMSDVTKKERIAFYQSSKFGGTADWAIDLQQFTDDDLDPNNDDDDDLPDTSPLPPCDAGINTFAQLDANAGSIDDHCVAQYTVAALQGLLSETLNNYTSLINSGYDKKFTVYANAVAGSASTSLLNFINGHGNSYAQCTVAEQSICCTECNANKLTDSYCNYCFDGTCNQQCSFTGCSNKRDGVGGSTEPVVKMLNESEPCPPDYSKRGYGPTNPYEQTVYWNWVNSSGFFSDLELNTGIPQSKTKMGNLDISNHCAPSASAGDACWGIGMYYNVPLVNGYSASDVANPKTVVSKGLDRIQSLPTQLSNLMNDFLVDGYAGDDMELIDTLALPVMMLASATENMASIAEIADEITEEQKKAFIMAFLSAIFMFVPVAGEIIAGVTELADIGAIMSLFGTVGNAALDIYTIVDDPANAPLAIFDLILSPLALADVATITKASNLRRAMKAEDVAKLGDKVKGRMDTIEKVKGLCVADMVSDGSA